MSLLDIYGPLTGPSQRQELTLYSHAGFMPSVFHSTYTCESQELSMQAWRDGSDVLMVETALAEDPSSVLSTHAE